MEIQPLNDLVMLRQIEAADVSAGGIIMPESAKEAPAEGTVTAIAADASDEIAIGDRVIYKKYSGEEIVVDGVTYRLVPADDLLAKFVEADAIPA
ncbi:MAG: co-chaperone GroES [Deltaproteobacteria bacterium]|nr:co-chaperone GroES [Deltaproteobacteria bacterium]